MAYLSGEIPAILQAHHDGRSLNIKQINDGSSDLQYRLQLFQPLRVLDGAEEVVVLWVGERTAGHACSHQLLEARLDMPSVVVVDGDELTL